MAATRKLQGEIDRCLKKVTEGVEIFEDIWQKVHNAANANQKEKYEADLKKEIKKLQRLRDQIKSWLASGEIKDKTILLDTRRLIETQMERFKVVERETKTKAYSKEGLGAAQKQDPAQRERDEANNWLSQSIENLQIQADQFETEIENLQMFTKKKKLDKDKQERIDHLKALLDRHHLHIKKLEMVMRLLDNMSIDVDRVNSIKDDVDYYIESAWQEPEFDGNPYIYDEINFDVLNQNPVREVGMNAAGLDPDIDVISGINTGSTPSVVSSSSPVPSLSAVGTASSSNSHHSMNEDIGSHSSVMNDKTRHRSSESETSGKRFGSTATSSTGSNSHGVNNNTSPLVSASVSPPPQQPVRVASPTPVPPSPVKGAPVPAANTAIASPAPQQSSISSATPNNSSSSSGKKITSSAAPTTNGPTYASPSPPSSPAMTPSAVSQQQRFALMNGLSSPSPATSMPSSSLSLPSSPHVVPSLSAIAGSASVGKGVLSSHPATTAPTSVMNSSVVRQLFQQTSASTASTTSTVSSSDSRTVISELANNRDELVNLGTNLISDLKNARLETSASSVPVKSEVAPLLGLAKEAVLNAQNSSSEAEKTSSSSTTKAGLSQLDLIAMLDSVRANSTTTTTTRSGTGSNPFQLQSSSTTSSTSNHLSLGVNLGGGIDKASIAAFMAENKLNALSSSTASLHSQISTTSLLGSVTGGQQPPGIGSSSGGGSSDLGSRLDVGSPSQSFVGPSSSASSVVSSTGSGETRIPPTVAINPLGPGTLSKDHVSQLKHLDTSLYRLPIQADSERTRMVPRSPVSGVPPFYPQMVPAGCDTMEFFSRLSTETLFFIFYYMEGTKAQYLAAKALKKQSWRFHTRYLMWFQRHEEPKMITDEYEQGAYIYFDFEKWSQRKKEGFTFEYRYLEDRDLN
ncbi:unnamed protein product [Notodromas monacha]|uniref:CCR4-NOT transcription complex subunit 3 n=1 Tax=Notodromas monacha TaxID=399045 RepID=A0A7R9BTY8_9CRUS|nr:unnamed protein product [Notodromas monacha]CAG0920685.1 unnamed protein product [Notodromas monacha]